MQERFYIVTIDPLPHHHEGGRWVNVRATSATQAACKYAIRCVELYFGDVVVHPDISIRFDVIVRVAAKDIHQRYSVVRLRGKKIRITVKSVKTGKGVRV